MKLYCYCCGEPIQGQIALITMRPDPTDRVFVAKPEHLENFDESTLHSLLVIPSAEAQKAVDDAVDGYLKYIDPGALDY